MNQLDLELGRALRDDGIKRAADHADAVTPKWGERAFAELCRIGPTMDRFTSADIRHAATAAGLPVPPDNRAWGSVFKRALKARRVAFVAYVPDPDPKSHRCPTAQYRWASAGGLGTVEPQQLNGA